MQIGDTFVLGEGGHLWIVISDPAKHDGEFIIVNMTTDLFRAGRECELNPGDHQWVNRKSYVAFGDARKVGLKEATAITKNMAAGTIRKHFPMKLPILQRIVGAAKVSKALPTGCVAYL